MPNPSESPTTIIKQRSFKVDNGKDIPVKEAERVVRNHQSEFQVAPVALKGVHDLSFLLRGGA